MLKICTVLFVASMTPVIAAQAASQAEIANLLREAANSNGKAEKNQSGTSGPETEALGKSCPDLGQLRAIDMQAALHKLYQPRQFAPLWDDQARLDSLRSELAALADDGLPTDAYPFSQQVSGALDTCAELRISGEYLRALEHLGSGRLAQQEHESMWRQEDTRPATPAVIEWAREGSQDLTAVFEQARPDLRLYRNLRDLHIQLRDAPPQYEQIPSGDLIRPGMQDPRVPLLAQRLESEGYLSKQSSPDHIARGVDADADADADADGKENTQPDTDTASTLTPQLADALKRFQAHQGLKADGVLGPNTLAALNMTPQERLELVRINLERLRWVNVLLADDALLVNSADNFLRQYEDGEVIWQTKVITGRPGRETPLLVSTLDRITLNPDWTVPPTIRREDMYPEIRRDLGYLERKNLEVIDYQGNRLDPAGINWRDPEGIMIRQPPGPDNPLGQVVFRFDNPYAVYLHDTPDEHLFDRVQRNISSGCVRVEGAELLADSLFGRMSAARQARIEPLRRSRSTHQVNVADGPQVILGYWTAEANAEGQLMLTQDPYGKDAALLDAFPAVKAKPEHATQNAGSGSFF